VAVSHHDATHIKRGIKHHVPGRNCESERLTAIHSLTSYETRGSVDALLQIAERQDESEVILRAAGTALGMLQDKGGDVSEWDLRNIGDVAGDAFFEAS
jgi:hypothetical protein